MPTTDTHDASLKILRDPDYDAADLERLSYSQYNVARVLGLYWEDGEEEYRRETRKFLSYLEKTFGFSNNVEFAIPSCESELGLLRFVMDEVVQMRKRLEGGKSGLLLIHYGGHGDEDLDPKSNFQRKAVWAATNEDKSATLRWYEVQRNLENQARCDVLIILDCCFAAQAGRDRTLEAQHTFEILAAAPMEQKTKIPGPGSFTEAIMRGCEELLAEKQFVKTSDLHARLASADFALPTTPSLFLRKGDHIVLRENAIREEVTPYQVQLSLVTTSIPQLAHFLRMSSGVSDYTINEIIEATTQAISMTTTEPCVSEVMTKNLITTTTEVISSPHEGAPSDSPLAHLSYSSSDTRQSMEPQNRLENTADDYVWKILRILDEANCNFAHGLIEELGKHPENGTGSAINPGRLKLLDRMESLMMKHGILHPAKHTLLDPENSTQRLTYDEYCRYSENKNDKEVMAISQDFQSLVRLLQVDKSDAFCTLPLRSGHPEPENNRFVLTFEIPTKYAAEKHFTLKQAILGEGGCNHPSVEERLLLASALANSIRQWHVIGWLHQSISSHKIILFKRADSGRLDYSSPFLGGFEYSRPTAKPSSGHWINNFDEDVYRHPRRLLDGQSRPSHKKIHDIYSLGVVLLEIGLWKNVADLFSRGNVDGHLRIQVMAGTLKQKAASEFGDLGSEYRMATARCLNSDFIVHKEDKYERELDLEFRSKVVNKLKALCKQN